MSLVCSSLLTDCTLLEMINGLIISLPALLFEGGLVQQVLHLSCQDIFEGCQVRQVCLIKRSKLFLQLRQPQLLSGILK